MSDAENEALRSIMYDCWTWKPPRLAPMLHPKFDEAFERDKRMALRRKLNGDTR